MPYEEPEATKIEKWIIFALIVGVLVVLFWPIKAPAATFRPTPLPYSCEQVRMALKVASKEHWLQMAKAMGITVTASQRAQAQKCIGGIHGHQYQAVPQGTAP